MPFLFASCGIFSAPMTSPSQSWPTNLWRRLRRKVTARVHALPWLRTRRNRSLADELPDAREVLFLCYGNICRSPFAERYARSIFPGHVRLASAGVFPTVGRPSPDAACVAAKRLGVELADHASRLATPALLREADVILIFDARNYLHVLDRGRDYLDKTYYLSDLDLSGPHLIPDPWGGGLEAFLATYRRIQGALDEALALARPAPGVR